MRHHNQRTGTGRGAGGPATWLAVLGLLGIWLTPHPACAQAKGQKGPSLTVSRLNDLAFGSVVGGTSVTLPPTNATAAKFEIRAANSSSITVTVTLPPALTMGAATLPISFGANSAGWSMKDKANTMTLFDPRQGAQFVMQKTKAYVWIGGSLSPPPQQAAGTYGGVITLSVVAN